MFAQQSLQPKLSHRRYAGVPYALQNNTVFRRAQNWVSDSDGSRTDNGSEFQSVGPETVKHLWPYLIVLERGTARSPRTVERRWPRLADSETSEHSSARYAGAAWCRLLYTRTNLHRVVAARSCSNQLDNNNDIRENFKLPTLAESHVMSADRSSVL